MQKTAIITGAYGVIGRAIAEIMAEKGWRLILVGRDAAKTQAVCQEIIRISGNSKIEPVGVDLSREAEIRSFALSLTESVDVLINNAGTTPKNRLETPEGIEMQWACNVLGYAWCMDYLMPKIKPSGRIVNVASFYAGGLDLSDVEFIKRKYDNDAAYKQSKQANRMLSAHFATLYQSKEVTVNSCHPGEINSKLSNNLGFFFTDPPRKGADTPVWVATDESLKGKTGKYFQYRHEMLCPVSKNPMDNKALYDLCKTYYGR